MSNRKILSVFWHSVESDSFSSDRVYPTQRLFREQLQFLLANYTPVSILDFLQLHERKLPVSLYAKPPVLLAFDDGFKNVIRHALPVLAEFRAPAVFFVIGEVLRNPYFVPWYVEVRHLIRRTIRETIAYGNGSVNLAEQQNVMRLRRLFAASFLSCRSESDRQTLLQDLADILGVPRPQAHDLDEDLQFVNGNDLAALTCSSLLTVASHAMTHRDLASLSYKEQVDELEGSDSLLRGQCPSYYPVIAYPNGSFTAETIGIAKHIYEAGFAVFQGASYRDLYAYPRIGIENDSVAEVEYAVSPKRRNYILPVKRLLHVTGIRPL